MRNSPGCPIRPPIRQTSKPQPTRCWRPLGIAVQLQSSIIFEYIQCMPTTVHIPEDLLQKVDERAKVLKITRNRYVVEALKQALAEQSSWSPAFLAELEEL